MKLFECKYGYFSEDGREYVITNPKTPKPWCNVISNGEYGMMVSQTGGGYSWCGNAGQNRITRAFQDLVRDNWGKYIYIRDKDSGKFWSASWKPVEAVYDEYKVRHGIGYTIFENKINGIETQTCVFVHPEQPMEYMQVKVRNCSDTKRNLDLTTYFEWVLGQFPDEHREYHKLFINTEFEKYCNCIHAEKLIWFSNNEEWLYDAFHCASQPVSSFETDKGSFLGNYGSESAPAAMKQDNLSNTSGRFTDGCGSLRVDVALDAGEEKVIVFTIGAIPREKHDYRDIASSLTSIEAAEDAFEGVRRMWDEILLPEQVETPDPALNLMTNIWLKYQAVSCRLWGKSAYYQTSAGYGFRDQLQDCQIFLTNKTELARKQILLHASHQFREGDVLHWWFTINGGGPRTKCSDDLLWLPYILDSYLTETGDYDILDEVTPYLDGGEDTLYCHCKAAIERCFHRFSPRGIPLMGDHDWNDGLSAIGCDWKGESFWLAEFLYTVLSKFIPLSKRQGDDVFAEKCTDVMVSLKESIDRFGWDGEWYMQATTDGFEKVGSHENDEGSIFLNPQLWAVISGIAENDKKQICMDSVSKYLLREHGALLLYPAYTKPRDNIGYITRYSPGLRENGGVYTHAATWAVWAYALMGDADSMYKAYKSICPPNNSENCDAYMAEPYVTPGNTDGPVSPFFGRGGWTWYTGSAQWLHRVATHWILGIRPQNNGLLVSPCIPKEWKEYRVKRTFRNAVYHILVKNPDGVSGGVKSMEVDGKQYEGSIIPDFHDGKEHRVVVVLG